MARAALLALLALASLAPIANAAPAARQRVVLADPDPELRHAMAQALAPWHLEVVIEGARPGDAAMARQRADADTARFVVWREAGTLVVYDRELDAIERRDTRAGVLDPPTAAAAALTIKTMMRLPPPPPPDEPGAAHDAAGERADGQLRLEAGLAMQVLHGDATELSARLGGDAELRPWPSAGWRVGRGGDVGTATSVTRAGFDGTWRAWAVRARLGWSHAYGAWEIEPHAGVGVLRSTLDGTEMKTPRSEATTLVTARGGLSLRRRLAPWSFGVTLDLDVIFGTPTYSKAGAAAEIFQVPGAGAALGTVIAVDL